MEINGGKVMPKINSEKLSNFLKNAVPMYKKEKIVTTFFKDCKFEGHGQSCEYTRNVLQNNDFNVRQCTARIIEKTMQDYAENCNVPYDDSIITFDGNKRNNVTIKNVPDDNELIEIIKQQNTMLDKYLMGIQSFLGEISDVLKDTERQELRKFDGVINAQIAVEHNLKKLNEVMVNKFNGNKNTEKDRISGN